MRQHLRASEVPVIMGVDASKTPWQIWDSLTSEHNNSGSQYPKWQGRLAGPIMQGIAADHGLTVQATLNPEEHVGSHEIMPPKGWKVAPCHLSKGRPAVLVVAQRATAALRDWKEPSQLPDRNRLTYQATALAYGVEVVLVGILVDGYESKLFAVELADQGPAIHDAVAAFLESARNGEEPELDFSKDAIEIKKGNAAAKLEASAEMIDELAARQLQQTEDYTQRDKVASLAKVALTATNTQLLALLNRTSPLETDRHRIVLKVNGKGIAQPEIMRKDVPALF